MKTQTNKKIMEWTFPMLMILVIFIVLSLIIYNIFYVKSYNEGYEYAIKDVIDKLRQEGSFNLCMNGDCEILYEYYEPCQEKPLYCDWDLMNNKTINWIFVEANISFLENLNITEEDLE